MSLGSVLHNPTTTALICDYSFADQLIELYTAI